MKKLKRYAVVASLLVVGLLLIAEGGQELWNSLRLAREGRSTTGQVVDRSVRAAGNSGNVYSLTIEFQTEDRAVFREDFIVSSDVYFKGVASGAVTVYYLADNPAICAAGEKVPLRFGGLLTGLGLFLAGAYLLWFFRFARKQVQNLCITEHEFATVDAQQFKHLDLAFYDEGQRLLASHQYRFLADREDLTFRRTSGLRIFIRMMLSIDGITMAGIYHLRQRWFLRCLGVKDSKVLDLETKFSNGHWVITSNAQAAGALDSPPGVDAIYLTAGTKFETLIESHCKRVVGFLKKHPGVGPTRMATLDDAQRLTAELQKLKAEYRRATGLTKPELERISGAGPSKEMDLLHEGVAASHETRKRDAA